MRRIRKSFEATSNLPHVDDDVTATLDLAQTRQTAPHGIPGAARPLHSAPTPSNPHLWLRCRRGAHEGSTGWDLATASAVRPATRLPLNSSDCHPGSSSQGGSGTSGCPAPRASPVTDAPAGCSAVFHSGTGTKEPRGTAGPQLGTSRSGPTATSSAAARRQANVLWSRTRLSPVEWWTFGGLPVERRQ
jgi:hypothetical protein